jgi:PAS domain S-box-containing protein
MKVASPEIEFLSHRDDPLRQADAFRTFFEEAPVGIFFFDPYDRQSVMRVVSCNDEACRMHGFRKEEIVGNSIRRFDPQFFIWDGTDYFEGSSFVEMLGKSDVHEGIAQHVRKNGQPLVVEYRTILLEVAEQLYVVGIELDVTERELQRIELQQTRQQIMDAIESMREGVMIFDASDKLVAFNEEAVRLLWQVKDLFELGISHEQILAAYANRISPEARGNRTVEEYVALSNQSRSQFVKNLPVRFLPGRHHRLSHWPMVAGGIVSVVTDVTELQTAIDYAEAASRAKSQFLGVVSHELRTPLNGIVGLISMLANTKLSEQQRKILEMLSASGTALSKIVGDVLDLSEFHADSFKLNLTPTDPIAICEDVFNLFRSTAAHKDLQYLLQFSGSQRSKVLADERRLRQIFSKLIGNAIKFTPVGSILVRVSLASLGDRIQVSIHVVDTGIGVSVDQRPNLFANSDGVNHRAPGAGLGLVMAKQLVDLMHGTIGYEPRPEGGSEFWFQAEFDPAD